MPASPTHDRKEDHIHINLEEDVDSGLTTGLEKYQFIHEALPEINFQDVDLSLTLFGHRLSAPILISSMTGGTREAASINRVLAAAAQQCGIAMGLGSQRILLEEPSLVDTFRVRDTAPDILLFANLGAIQLNHGIGVEECQRMIDLVEADGLIFHLNPLQEAVQPEGQTNFRGLLEKIEHICGGLQVPVIVKEVGWGLSERAAHYLYQAGVSALDTAGAGGTSWTQVEMYRSETEAQRKTAAAFLTWGIPTAQSILMARKGAPDLPLIASGGLRTGLDIAKCIALGADLGGIAGPLLKAAVHSGEETIQTIQGLIRELRTSMFAAGARDLSQLSPDKLFVLETNEHTKSL